MDHPHPLQETYDAEGEEACRQRARDAEAGGQAPVRSAPSEMAQRRTRCEQALEYDQRHEAYDGDRSGYGPDERAVDVLASEQRGVATEAKPAASDG